SSLAIMRWTRDRRAVQNLVFLYAAPMAAYWLLRWKYYGLFFPLSYYIKVASHGDARGLAQVSGFFLHILGLLPWVVLGARRFGRPAIPMLTAVLALTIFYLFPEHWMCYDWRYLFPLLPSLLVLAAIGLTSGLARFSADGVKSGVVYAGCILAFLSSLSWKGL